jgi:hypothetical protein
LGCLERKKSQVIQKLIKVFTSTVVQGETLLQLVIEDDEHYSSFLLS